MSSATPPAAVGRQRGHGSRQRARSRTRPGNGGEAWVRPSWVAGCAARLRRVFVEEIQPRACATGRGRGVPFERSSTARTSTRPSTAVRLDGSAALLHGGGEARRASSDAQSSTRRASRPARQHQRPPDARAAAARVRREGVRRHRPRLHAVLARAAARRRPRRPRPVLHRRREHRPGPGCPIPTGGIDWRPIRQPVVLDDWPPSEPTARRTVHDRGELARRLRPGRARRAHATASRRTSSASSSRCRATRVAGRALRARARHPPGDGDDLGALLARTAGGSSTRGAAPATRPRSGDYVQGSGAEFSVAQGIYVETQQRLVQRPDGRATWPRGKPALVQDTGFGRHLRSARGCVAFRRSTRRSPARAAIVADYPRHCRAARAHRRGALRLGRRARAGCSTATGRQA